MKLRNLALLFLILGVVSCRSEQKTETVPAQPHGDEWVVNADQSQLTVEVIKDANIPVKGSLKVIAGSLSKTQKNDWSVVLRVAVNSWNSGLDLRDERVKNTFFQVSKPGFEELRFEAYDIPHDVVQGAQSGKTQNYDLKGFMVFNGMMQNLIIPVEVKSENHHLVVKGQTPISIQQWGLNENKLSLMKECNHQNILDQVSVSFDLKLE